MKLSNPKRFFVGYTIPFDILRNNEPALVGIVSFLPPGESRSAVEALLGQINDSILEQASKTALVHHLKKAENYWEERWEEAEIPTTIDQELKIYNDPSYHDLQMDTVLCNLELLVENDSSPLGDLLRQSRETYRSQHRVYGKPSHYETPHNVLSKLEGETWHDLYDFFWNLLTFVASSSRGVLGGGEAVFPWMEVFLNQDAADYMRDLAPLVMWLVFGTPSLPMSLMTILRQNNLRRLVKVCNGSERASSPISDSRYCQMASRFETEGLIFHCCNPQRRQKMEGQGLLRYTDNGSILVSLKYIYIQNHFLRNSPRDTLLPAIKTYFTRLMQKAFEQKQLRVDGVSTYGQMTMDENIEDLIYHGMHFYFLLFHRGLYSERDRLQPMLDLAYLLSIYRDGSFHRVSYFLSREEIFDVTKIPLLQKYSDMSNWINEFFESHD